MAFNCKIGLHTWAGSKCSECGKFVPPSLLLKPYDKILDCLVRGYENYQSKKKSETEVKS